MTDTPNLALPLLAAAQAQKHVTHNEALLAIDALLQCAVIDKDIVTPPTSPAVGARYIVPAGAAGAWSGQATAIAVWQDGAWTFRAPKPGFVAFVVDEALLYFFGGSAWMPLNSTATALQNLARLGFGTTADATNPFAAKLNKALWTAKTAAEGGTGDLRYTMNKEAAANVVSLLFQSGYSGRAEMGLTGSDDFALKVSADGSTFRTALIASAATGGVDFGSAATVLASAATVDLGAAGTRRVDITGTTAITSFGTVPNRERLIRFSGASTLTHNATSLTLPGGASLTTAAGDTAVATSDASGNWIVRQFTRAVAAQARADIGAYGSGDSPSFSTVSASGQLVAANGVALNLGGSLAYVYTDSASHGFTFRTGPGSAYKYSGLDANGLFTPAGGIKTAAPIYPNADAVQTIGTSTFRFGGGYFAGLTVGGGGSGYITLQPGSGVTGYTEYRKPDNTRLGYIGFSASDMAHTAENGARHVFGGGNVVPGSDNTLSLGSSGSRWTALYAATGAIQTSDAQVKAFVAGDDITADVQWRVAPLSEAEINVAQALAAEIGRWIFRRSRDEKGLDRARIHCGLTVQRAAALFDGETLDPWRYAFMCRDATEAQDAVAEQAEIEAEPAVWSDPVMSEEVWEGEGDERRLVRPAEVLEEPKLLRSAVPARPYRAAVAARPAGEVLSFRPDELLHFMLAGQHAATRRLEARIAELETRFGAVA